MRARFLIAGLLALACTCLPASVEASRWTKKSKREEEKREVASDPLGLSKRQAAAPSKADRHMDEMLRNLESASAGGMDMQAIIKSTIDTMVEQLENPQTRAAFSKESLIELLSSMPADTNGIPGMEGGVSAALEKLEALDDKELQKEIDTILDGILEHGKNLQQQLSQPNGLQTMIAENLKALGLSDEDMQQMQELLTNPDLLTDTLNQVMEGMDDLDLSPEEIQELRKQLADPDALNEMMEQILSEDDIQEAMQGVNLDELFGDLANDPEIQKALGDKASGSKRQRGSEDVKKAPRRRFA